LADILSDQWDLLAKVLKNKLPISCKLNIRKIIIRQAKLSIILLILGLCVYGLPGRGFCADYSQHEDFGVKKAGDIISFTVTPPGKV